MAEDSPPTSKFEAILDSLGVQAGALEKVRLGGGVVGKISYAVIALILVLGVIARQTTDPRILIILAGGAVGVFLIYLVSILVFTARHKEFALLDGAELIAYRHLEITAKDNPNPPKQPIVTDPARAQLE
jgi:hypothetical protein